MIYRDRQTQRERGRQSDIQKEKERREGERDRQAQIVRHIKYTQSVVWLYIRDRPTTHRRTDRM